MKSVAVSKYFCPKCGQTTLQPDDNDLNRYVCTSCGDVWNVADVRRYHFQAVGEDHGICEACDEQEAEVEFRMPLPLPRDQVGLPVGYTVVKGNICLDCYGSTDDDRTLAIKILAHQEKIRKDAEHGDAAKS